MTKLEKLARDVRALDRNDLKAFRAWFAEYDAALWDRQIEADSAGERLDALGAAALDAHRQGRTREI
jgi:hypothetical protein